MAIAYHTHTFSVPTADAADLLAGTEGGKVITPEVLGPVTAAGKALMSAANVAAQRAALDLEPGDADLTALAGLDKSDGNFIVGDGSTWVAESGATARASLGLAIGTDVQAYSANLTEYAAVNPTTAGLALLDDVDASAQRTTLGLAIGTDVQAYDADLTALAGLDKSDGNFIVGNGTTWVAESGATARDSLGLTIGTDVQAYSANLTEYAAVNPTAAGLALLDDADASAQRTTLGLAIGTDVQAYDADLSAIAALAKTDGNFIVGNGTTWTAESGATARDSLGLGTADSPQYTAIELGHASDTTISRGAAGFVAVEGKRVPSPASQAAGDILYRGGTEWERLAKGTAGQLLAMNSGATAPEWVPAQSSSNTYGAVGTYAFAGTLSNVNTNTTHAEPGGTVAGSTLGAVGLYGLPSSGVQLAPVAKGVALSGTWKCMGYSRNDGGGLAVPTYTLWLRIS